MAKDIYEYIIEQTSAYQTRGVAIADNYEWSMFEHIKRSFLYKNSKFWKGANDGNRPFKNIILPILDVAYRTEGFDVKDIVPFVNDQKNYYKSFLVKHYHPKWARKNNIDTFIDEMVESYTDFGLALVKNVNSERPEVEPLQSLAFADQTDILSGPLCKLLQLAPDEMLDMVALGWDKDQVDALITLAESGKTVLQAEGQKAATPGKYIQAFELHGVLPTEWLKKSEDDESYGDAKFTRQMQICAYYMKEDGTKQGITLYKGKEKPGLYKAIVRKPIFGRACGLGGIEELFEPQTWVNYSEIQQKEMLDVASMIIVQTADEQFEEKNGNLSDQEKGAIVTHAENKPLSQVNLQPINRQAFEEKTDRWEENARKLGSADDALLGAPPAAGTPFKLQDLVVQEGKGSHDYRRGKVATFMGEIYRDWSLKRMVKEMNDGKTFMEELSLDELQAVADQVVTNEVNREIIQGMLKSGFDAKIMSPDARDALVEEKKALFMKKGGKRFMETLKGELDKLPIDVEMNIAGKQSDLSGMADKLTNIFRAIIVNPQILQQPGMGKLFNEILESAGLSPIDFTSFTKSAPAAPAAAPPAAPVATAVPSPVGAPQLTPTN